jgi:hypothetical protein
VNEKGSVTFLEPWMAVDSHAEGLEKQLRREVALGHPLHSRRVRAIARRQDCDDVLFVGMDDRHLVAVVHLTWASQTVVPPFPSTKFFSSFEEWVEQGMKVDHQEFVVGETWSWPGSS